MSVSDNALHYRALLFDLSKPSLCLPKCLTKPGHMWIQCTQLFEEKQYKLMEKYALKHMSAGYAIARSQMQLERYQKVKWHSSVRNPGLCNVGTDKGFTSGWWFTSYYRATGWTYSSPWHWRKLSSQKTNYTTRLHYNWSSEKLFRFSNISCFAWSWNS